MAAIDGADAEGPVSPVYYRDHSEFEPDPNCPSIGQMVLWWIEALDRGASCFDSAAGRWRRREELVPLEQDLSRLV